MIAASIETPGPRGWPILGSLVPLARDPFAFYRDLPRAYGDVCVFRIGNVRTFIVAHPDGVHQVLVEHREVMHKDQITSSLGRILGQGLLTSEDPLWGRQRKLAAPSFQPRQLAVYGQAMIEAARAGLAEIRADGPRDVHADMARMTREIVLRTLFGAAHADGERVADILDAFSEAFEGELRSVLRLLPPSWPTPVQRKMAALRRQLLAVVDRLIAERSAGPAAGSGDDLLSRYLAARDEQGAPMSPDQLRDEVITVFLAGHETTALALTFALWLLAAHPAEQAKVRAEIATVTGGAAVAPEQRKELRYVEAVVQETLRLYPPAWVIGRTATRDVVVSGHCIPRGSQILVPIYALHRDPRFWPEPDTFRPERWLGEATATQPRFAYLPFGGGQRVCVGNHFALLEAVLVLATWVQAVELEPVPGATLDLRPAVTMRPRSGVQVAVRRVSA